MHLFLQLDVYTTCCSEASLPHELYNRDVLPSCKSLLICFNCSGKIPDEHILFAQVFPAANYSYALQFSDISKVLH